MKLCKVLVLSLLVLAIFGCADPMSVSKSDTEKAQSPEDVFKAALAAEAVMGEVERNTDTRYPVNLAQGKPTGAKSYYVTAFNPPKAVDGKSGTLWASSLEGVHQWYYVDLRTIKSVAILKIDWFDKYYASKYDIYVTNDLKNFNRISSINNGDGGVDAFLINERCRYVGIMCLEKNDIAYAIREFEIYEKATVGIPDTNLRAGIRAAINKPSGDIYNTDLIGLTNLDVHAKSITNTAGIEYCYNLTTLNIGKNQIKDISRLAGLYDLTTLHIAYCTLYDIEALKLLKKLSVLTFNHNQVKDLIPIATHDNLTSLTIAWNGMVIKDDGVLGKSNLDIVNYHINNGCKVNYEVGNDT